MGYNDALFLAMVEWNSYDDHINLKTDPDKPATNLIPIRANENVFDIILLNIKYSFDVLKLLFVL